MEPTLSLFAWIGVILLQVMVHRYLRARRRHPSTLGEEPALLAAVAAAAADTSGSPSAPSPTVNLPASKLSRVVFRARAQSFDSACLGDRTPATVATDDSPSRGSVCLDERGEEERDLRLMDSLDFDDESDGPSFDGDEPRLFFQLLSQTGSEMMTSRRSLEHLVREQMDERPAVLCS